MPKATKRLEDNEKDIYFTELTHMTSHTRKATVESSYRSGIYDLAGPNVSGIYDISSEETNHHEGVYESAGQNDIFEGESISGVSSTYHLQNDMRLWFARHKQKIIVIGIVISCLLVGVGTPLQIFGYFHIGHLNRTGKELADNMTAESPQGIHTYIYMIARFTTK